MPGPTSSKVGRPMEKRLKQMTWGLDSMASVHCTGNKELLSNRKQCSPMRILCANDDSVVATSHGTVTLRVRTRGGNTATLKVSEVYYCPDIGANLLSLVKLVSEYEMSMSMLANGVAVLATKKGTYIPLQTSQSLLTIEGDTPAIAYSASAIRTIKTVDDLISAHCRLGHMGIDRLLEVLKLGKTRGLGKLNMNVSDIVTARERILHCDACKAGKGTQQSFSHRGPLNHGTLCGEVLHMDTFEVRATKESSPQWGVVIVDPFSGSLFCPIVSSKDKVAEIVIEVMKKFKAFTGKTVKVLHSDGGTEFINRTLKAYCASVGTTMTRSPPKVPTHNGIAERYVRIIKDGARTMLMHCGLPATWWHRAVVHFVYIWNRTFVCKATGKTPYETCYGLEPSVSSTNVFGCDVYVWLHKSRRQSGTFASRGEPGIYLGHDPEANCAIVWLIKSNKEVRERSIDYRDDQFNYARAFTSGACAIDIAVSKSDVGGELSWCEPSDIDNESKLQQVSESSQVIPVRSESEEGNEHSDSEPEDAYEVESILNHRPVSKKKSADQYEYEVQWKGYADTTWEPQQSLVGGAGEVYHSYRKSVGFEVSDDDEPVDESDSQ